MSSQPLTAEITEEFPIEPDINDIVAEDDTPDSDLSSNRTISL